MRKVIAIFLLVLGVAELVQFFMDFDPDRQIPQYVWSLLYPTILIAAGYQLWFAGKVQKHTRSRSGPSRKQQPRSQQSRSPRSPSRSSGSSNSRPRSSSK